MFSQACVCSRGIGIRGGVGMPGGRYTKGGRYPRGVGIPNRPVLASSGDHKWAVSILLQ